LPRIQIVACDSAPGQSARSSVGPNLVLIIFSWPDN
jgi:hypothetical protein